MKGERKMDFGVTGKLGGYYLAEQYQKNVVPDKNRGVSFAKLAVKKETAAGISFKDMWQTRFPRAYYSVMDTSKIDDFLWGRNDYPWDKYFNNNVDDSVLDWKPSGAEPTMLDSKVQAKTDLAKSVMAKVEGFIVKQDIMNPNPRKGYLIALDENGDIAHACVTSEKMSMSSAEFIEVHKARKERHAEYERFAEEVDLKRKLRVSKRSC